MLTPYDEFPVHQVAHTFSYIPSTDYNWDDGYYFGVFNPDEGVFLATGARINPNSDIIGGYALLNVRGHQTTLRFNRTWRRDFNLKIGPWEAEFVEPLRKIRLVLRENQSGIRFDLLWEGTSPAFLEEHHVAVNRGRRTTDQTRYSQPGMASGSIGLRGTGDGTWPRNTGAGRAITAGGCMQSGRLSLRSRHYCRRARSTPGRNAPCASGPASARTPSAASFTCMKPPMVCRSR